MRGLRMVSLLGAFRLAGCQSYHIQMSCREQAGPEPNQVGHMFGLIGSLAMQSTPEWQTWNDHVAACVNQKKQEVAAAQASTAAK